jgi:hypothetical protein
MASVQQYITTEFMNQLKRKFSVQRVQVATQNMADEAIKIMRDRCNEGIDVNGKRFAPFTKGYIKYKKKYVKTGKKVNEFAAKKLPNHIRLSGALFGAMKNQIIQYAQFSALKINSTFRLYIDKSQEKKVQGLLSDTGYVKTLAGKKSYKKAARKFFGIATGGTREKKERERLFNVFAKSLNFKVVGNKLVVK